MTGGPNVVVLGLAMILAMQSVTATRSAAPMPAAAEGTAAFPGRHSDISEHIGAYPVRVPRTRPGSVVAAVGSLPMRVLSGLISKSGAWVTCS
jgi:hypothetical protein